MQNQVLQHAKNFPVVSYTLKDYTACNTANVCYLPFTRIRCVLLEAQQTASHPLIDSSSACGSTHG